MRKSQKKRFTAEEIERYRADPNVKDVREDRLRFTLAFRQRMYDAVKDHIGNPAIKQFLRENGYDPETFGKNIICTLSSKFKSCGRPKYGDGISVLANHPEHWNDQDLLRTGKFKRYRNGIGFTEIFVSELGHAYPEQSIEDGLRKAGIDPEMAGYQRIYTLKRKLDGKSRQSRKTSYGEEIIARYSHHPYVKSISHNRLVLSAAFFNETHFFKDMKIDDILAMYEIQYEDLSLSARNNIYYKLRNWIPNDEVQADCSEQSLRIQYRRMKALEDLLTKDLREYGAAVSSLAGNPAKRKLLELIQEFPADRSQGFTRTRILKLAGISRSNCYEILKNDAYGAACARREAQDQKDIETIHEVIAYRGFAKGSRQIYMNMRAITGEQFGLNKIRRLMHKAGIITPIRRKNQSRQSTLDLVKRNVKPNLLKRQFKLYEPDEVRLTDVTYLDYGNRKRAYGSAVKDPVSNRLIDLTVSSSNDLFLAQSSLNQIARDGITDAMILHSDQGLIYLNDSFQRQVKELGMVQSMSKRGNCWDNAPQESFFGHFKDEADYRSCRTLEELQAICLAYKDYYNTERRQWNLNRMTPENYSEYLKHLPAEVKQMRVETERKKYEAMKKRAAAEAIVRSTTLGV
jgi:transposase InsO family protein